MPDSIRDWLGSLGLSEYVAAFAENKIEFAHLSDLTEGDLRELGVAAMGHRKTLLRAIADLSDAGPVSVESASQPEATIAEAERRQLTVMFCDLAGSTALSTRLDPEDYREIIRAYQDACASVIARYDGYVAKFMGDGVLAYFGWPRSHEDDAARAISAGLGIIGTVAAIPPADGESASPAVRIGIATGPVVVGDIVGQGAAQEAAVTGETPNLAARLQAIAAPNSVVIAAATHALAGGLFEYEDLGDQTLKGIDGSTKVWGVVAERRVESRFAAAHTTALTPLIGRQEELELLSRRWERAKSGSGQVVLLSGEPGIGKSRLTRAIQDWIGDEPHTRLLFQCSPHHTNSALYPIISQLEHAAGIGSHDAVDTKLEKLDGLLAHAGRPTNEIIPLIASLLSISTEDLDSLSSFTPQEQKERTLAVLVDLLAGLAEQQPVLLIFEDAHWIDPTSLELMDLIIARITNIPVLVVVTYRPEFIAPWVGLPNATLLTLNRLDADACMTMAEKLSENISLPRKVITQLIEKTDGVPLFVEELTRSVLDSAAIPKEGGGRTPASAETDIIIPTTLQDALEARFDRSPEAREVAQAGAAIGREFPYDLLARVVSLTTEQLDAALDDLAGSGLVFARGTPPNATYNFKHALVQNAAYESLLRTRRRDLHQRLADLLEGSPTSGSAPEVIAWHLTEAGSLEHAVKYWQMAGTRAAQRAANAEAVEHLRAALNLLDAISEDDVRLECELSLQIALGPALMATRGWAADEVRQTYERALVLCKQRHRADMLFPTTWGLWMHHQGRSNHRSARPLADELLQLGEASADAGLILQGRHAAWTTRFYMGEFSAAREHYQKGIVLYDSMAHADHALSYGGHDPGVCGYAQASIISWLLGHFAEAADNSERSLKLAEQLGHAPSLAHALMFAQRFHCLRRDIETTLKMAESCVELSEKLGLPMPLAAGRILRGWATSNSDPGQSGIAEIERGITAFREMHARAAFPYYLALMAETLERFGDSVAALASIKKAPEVVEMTNERYWEAELFRLRGLIRLWNDIPGHEGDPQDDFEHALAISRAQGAKSLELRAGTSLARAWHSQSKTTQARNLLTPIYGSFTEGLDTPDLIDARALLDELG